MKDTKVMSVAERLVKGVEQLDDRELQAVSRRWSR